CFAGSWSSPRDGMRMMATLSGNSGRVKRMSEPGLIGFKGNGFAVDLGEGVHGGFLLGLFLVAAPRGGVALPADHRGDLEAFGMVGAFFVQEMILRRGVELALRDLLEQRLEVAAVSPFRDLLDLGTEIFH